MRERKSDHVEVTAFDARDVAASATLDAVGASFIVGFLGGKVAGDFFCGDLSEMHQGAFHELTAIGIWQANEGYSGDNGMSAAGELFEGAAGIIVGARLAENVSIEDHNGIGGDNDGRANGACGDQISFGVGQALNKFAGIFAGIRRFIHGRGEDGKRNTSVAKNFSATRRCRGENYFHG